jgi:hypothetical protein
MDILTAIGVGILLVVFIVVMYKMIAATTRVVPQEQQLVIYRLGRFHRVAGPGLVQVIPRLERVVRTIEVRDHPIEVTVTGIFAYGVPNDLTLNLWCSFDVVRAAGGDRARLAEFVQIRDDERRRQVEVKMREALVEQVAELQKWMPLPKGATTLEGVIALVPGSDRYNALMAGVKSRLEQTLPSVGVILDTSKNITLMGRGLSNEIIEAIQQKRSVDISGKVLMDYAAKLKQDFPAISDAVVAQILGSIPGVELGDFQRLRLEKERGEAEVEADVEYELPEDGSPRVNVIAKPKTVSRKTTKERDVESPADAKSAAHAADEHLRESDWAVLKRVPRRNRDQRMRT